MSHYFSFFLLRCNFRLKLVLTRICDTILIDSVTYKLVLEEFKRLCKTALVELLISHVQICVRKAWCTLHLYHNFSRFCYDDGDHHDYHDDEDHDDADDDDT